MNIIYHLRNSTPTLTFEATTCEEANKFYKLGRVGDTFTGEIRKAANYRHPDIFLQRGTERPPASKKSNNTKLTREFALGWAHFCGRINFDKSALDAEAIRFMNEMPAKITKALTFSGKD